MIRSEHAYRAHDAICGSCRGMQRLGIKISEVATNDYVQMYKKKNIKAERLISLITYLLTDC